MSKLIKTAVVTLYKQNENNEIVWESDYSLFINDKNDPLKFIYNSNSDISWRYDLKDIPIFFHNLWWDAILILFNLYELNIWGSNKSESTLNKFRLKTILLQLLGGLSKLNMLEKVDRFYEKHYTINESNYKNIKSFEKKLIKLEKCLDENSLNLYLENLIKKVDSEFTLTKDMCSRVDLILYGEPTEIIEDPFKDKTSKNTKNIDLTLDEKIKLKLEKSKKEFRSNYNFNVLLIFLLSLENVIKLIYNTLNKVLKEDDTNKIYLNKLENFLISSINNYIVALSKYNEICLDLGLDNVKLISRYDDIPSIITNEDKSLSITLLFSGVKIEYNTENSSSINKNNTKNNVKKGLVGQETNLNWKYSTLNFKSYNTYTRRFSTSVIRKRDQEINNNLLKNMQDNKESSNVKPKDINYSKSIFSLLDQIKELTKNKNYDPQEVQLKIEKFWFDILKERYNDNVYNSIRDIQPKIYEIFVTRDPNSLKVVFPDLYLFLDDIKVYLITYSVITTYFRRSSRTAICSLVADQILYYIYQTYFIP